MKKRALNLRNEKDRMKFYQTSEWKITRMIILKDNPFCEQCIKNGILKEAIDVDHIIDLKDRPDLCFTGDNLQALCKSCHSKKTYKVVSNGYKTELLNLKWKYKTETFNKLYPEENMADQAEITYSENNMDINVENSENKRMEEIITRTLQDLSEISKASE